jgi:hypothetical protein
MMQKAGGLDEVVKINYPCPIFVTSTWQLKSSLPSL